MVVNPRLEDAERRRERIRELDRQGVSREAIRKRLGVTNQTIRMALYPDALERARARNRGRREKEKS